MSLFSLLSSYLAAHGDRLSDLERKRFLMDAVAGHSQPLGVGNDGLAEAVGAADVDVRAGQVRRKPLEQPGVEPDVVARTDDLVKVALATVDEGHDLVTVDDVALSGCPDDYRDLRRRRQILEQGARTA